MGEQMEERSFHTGGVTGSIPVAPTIQTQTNTGFSASDEGVNAGSAEPSDTLAGRYGAGVEKAGVRSSRRYGQWAGNPDGSAEDPTRCIEEISDRYSFRNYQCTRPRGHGPGGYYCKQHDPAAVEARRKASAEKSAAEWKRLMRPHDECAAFRAVLQKIADGHNDPRGLAAEVLAKFTSPPHGGTNDR